MNFSIFASINESATSIAGEAICVAVGCISLAMSLVIAISQLYVIAKTKNTSGTSIWTYLIFVIMGLVSAAWGFTYYFQNAMGNAKWSASPTLHQWMIVPILTYYVGDIVFASTILTIKAYHMRLAKKLHKTELELATYLTNKQHREYIDSGYRRSKSKYFPLILYLTIAIAILALFAILFTIYTRPLVKQDPVGYPMDDTMITVLGFIGAAAWEALSWPQFVQCLKKRDTSGISQNWAVFLPIACTISFLYALLLSVTMIPGSFDWKSCGGVFFNGLIVNYGIMIIKMKNRKAARRHHLSELDYTKQILAPKIEARLAKKAAKKQQKKSK
ncbi:MAG: hypothetical protein ACOQNY_03095 [Mycoplasmoidaceae bacterium]